MKLISLGRMIPRKIELDMTIDSNIKDAFQYCQINSLLDEFAFSYDREQVKIPKPDFKKGDPIRYSGAKSGEIYKYVNKKVDSYRWQGESPDYDWRKYYNKKDVEENLKKKNL